jgi:hypothetical protein
LCRGHRQAPVGGRHELISLAARPLGHQRRWTGRPTCSPAGRRRWTDRYAQRPIDGLDRSDRSLGQVSDDHRGQLVDLAVKGQLARPKTTTTSTSTSSLRCGAMRSPWSSRTRLACRSAPSSRHRAPGWPPAAARLARSTGGIASGMLPSCHPTPSSPEHAKESRGQPAGSRPGSTRRPGTARRTRPGTYRLHMAGLLRWGHGTASPAVPAPRPGPCTRPRIGRCRGHPAGPTPPADRVKGAWRPCGTACGGP